MAEMDLDELAAKTHRGLTGLALAGYSADGLPFGYRSIQDCSGRKRQIYEPHTYFVISASQTLSSGRVKRLTAVGLRPKTAGITIQSNVGLQGLHTAGYPKGV